MLSDKYKNQDGYYVDANGIEHPLLEEFIQDGVLEFCVCGRKKESLRYIMEGLEFIKERIPDDLTKDQREEWLDDYFERLNNHFKSEGAKYFFYYWTDKEGYTEHGSRVPGWLTEEGEELLGLLKEIEWGKYNV